VDQFVAGSCRDATLAARLQKQFTLWKDNGAELEPLAERSFLVKEAEPLSQRLTVLGVWGLSALDAIDHKKAIPDSDKANMLSTFETIKKPAGQLLLVPATAVQKLVEATSNGGACATAH